jgi:hypothetical protein
MVRQDIVAALRNALERGEDIGLARQSLINAGYSITEVQQAESYLTGGIVKIQESPQEYSPPSQPSQDLEQNDENYNPQQNIPEDYSQQKPQPSRPKNPLPHSHPSSQKSMAGLIILTIVLFLLIGTTVIGFIFKEELFALLESMFG